MRFRLLVLFGLFVLTAGRQSVAVVDIIIDDAQAEFSEFPMGTLQTGTGNNAYDDGYRFIQAWGAFDGCGDGSCPDARSARVFYRLPSGELPPGDRLYNVYAWMPAVLWEWHVLTAAADGTDRLPIQDIDWVGQSGTNRQWLQFDEHKAFDPMLGGRWLKLGPGPQADINADGGSAYHLNPVHGAPFFYVEYQPFYNGLIAFDAIRIVELPGQGFDGDYNDDGSVDAADYVVWRRNEGTTITLPNDPHGDVIDQDQYNTWRANFGLTSGSGSTAAVVASAVPEPAALLLVAFAAVSCCGTRTRALCASR